jgi:hypothetical protein
VRFVIESVSEPSDSGGQETPEVLRVGSAALRIRDGQLGKWELEIPFLVEPVWASYKNRTFDYQVREKAHSGA